MCGLENWSRQYATPSMDALLSDLRAEPRAGLLKVRAWIEEQVKVRPKLHYSGVAWRWNEAFELDSTGRGCLNSVHLIPDPEVARVAVCCDRHFFDTHPLASIPKSLHAGLGDGVCIGNKAWCTWAVTGSDAADPIIELLDRLIGE